MKNKDSLKAYIKNINEKSEKLKNERNKDILYKELQDIIHNTRRAINLLDTMYLNK